MAYSIFEAANSDRVKAAGEAIAYFANGLDIFQNDYTQCFSKKEVSEQLKSLDAAIDNIAMATASLSKLPNVAELVVIHYHMLMVSDILTEARNALVEAKTATAGKSYPSPVVTTSESTGKKVANVCDDAGERTSLLTAAPRARVSR